MPPATAAAMSAGRLLASTIGRAVCSLLVTCAHWRASCAISTELVTGPTAWLSSAPPCGMITLPLSGSTKVVEARPSQNSSVNQAAVRNDCDWRSVTWLLKPNSGSGMNRLLASLRRSAGEAKMSSAVPVTPSGPGCVLRRRSPPPELNRWQVPQATRLFDESCSSQNSSLPRIVFSGVIGF